MVEKSDCISKLMRSINKESKSTSSYEEKSVPFHKAMNRLRFPRYFAGMFFLECDQANRSKAEGIQKKITK